MRFTFTEKMIKIRWTVSFMVLTMHLDDLNDFLLVAGHGGLGKASRISGRSKATLSRRILEFEEAIGVRLLERGSRSIELTQAGQSLLAQTAGPLQEIKDAMSAARDAQSTPRGLLRIAAPVLFSQLALGSIAAGFLQRYPAIQVEVISEDRISDLVGEHFDVAIRVNPGGDDGLVGRCFAKDRLVLTATPGFRIPEGSNTRAVPVDAVVMSSFRAGDVWKVNDSKIVYDPRPVLKLSSLISVRDAVLCGAGVAMLPQSIITGHLKRRELVSWGISGAETQLWVLHTSRRLQSPKVKCFVEFICSRYTTGWFMP
ncbi:LysR family transcriptional regulator [Pantoea vagans]|uniref:LysR family transcriptional regulator n=1 Tax=Pantoea vagans TaxID=470934 RepID=UPI00301A4B36